MRNSLKTEITQITHLFKEYISECRIRLNDELVYLLKVLVSAKNTQCPHDQLVGCAFCCM